jgi:hypothetical protein
MYGETNKKNYVKSKIESNVIVYLESKLNQEIFKDYPTLLYLKRKFGLFPLLFHSIVDRLRMPYAEQHSCASAVRVRLLRELDIEDDWRGGAPRTRPCIIACRRRDDPVRSVLDPSTVADDERGLGHATRPARASRRKAITQAASDVEFPGWADPPDMHVRLIRARSLLRIFLYSKLIS